MIPIRLPELTSGSFSIYRPSGRLEEIKNPIDIPVSSTINPRVREDMGEQTKGHDQLKIMESLRSGLEEPPGTIGSLPRSRPLGSKPTSLSLRPSDGPPSIG